MGINTSLPPLHTLTGSPLQPVALTPQQQKAILMGKLARVLLFAYILLMFKPVMPILADMMAHTFWLQKHLMEVHEVNGKFHIHTELGRAAHQSDSQRSANLTYEVEQYLYTVPDVFKALLFNSPAGEYISYACFYPVTPHSDIISPPPQIMAQDKISEAMIDGSLFRA
jgi:hypothetical protein